MLSREVAELTAHIEKMKRMMSIQKEVIQRAALREATEIFQKRAHSLLSMFSNEAVSLLELSVGLRNDALEKQELLLKCVRTVDSQENTIF